MTREEAKIKLQYIRMHYPSKDIENLEADNALYMAIEALNQLSSYEQTINKLTNAIAEQKPKFGHCNKCDFHADWQLISENILPSAGLYFITWEGKRDNQNTASRYIELAEYFENHYGDLEWDVSHIEANGYHDIRIIAWMDLPDKWEGD